MTTLTQNQNTTSRFSPLTANLLQTMLRADGVFSMILGAGGVAASGLLAEFFALPNGLAFVVVGIFLIFYGASMLYMGRDTNAPNWFAWFTIEVDLLWVIGSLIIIFSGAFPISDASKIALFVVADGVLVVAALKYMGYRQRNAKNS